VMIGERAAELIAASRREGQTVSASASTGVADVAA
jgi:hypothetical protein